MFLVTAIYFAKELRLFSQLKLMNLLMNLKEYYLVIKNINRYTIPKYYESIRLSLIEDIFTEMDSLDTLVCYDTLTHIIDTDGASLCRVDELMEFCVPFYLKINESLKYVITNDENAQIVTFINQYNKKFNRNIEIVIEGDGYILK